MITRFWAAMKQAKKNRKDREAPSNNLGLEAAIEAREETGRATQKT